MMTPKNLCSPYLHGLYLDFLAPRFIHSRTISTSPSRFYAQRQAIVRRSTPARPPPSRTFDRRTPPRRPVRPPARSAIPPKQQQQQQQQPAASSLESVSTALQNASPEQNSLLSTVNISPDPLGILQEDHPATAVLAHSSLVVTRQLELMNLVVGFEQANKYTIMDGSGNTVGFMAEKDIGVGGAVKRQAFRTHRSFETHVFDRSGREVLRFHRPFAWISSRIGVYDPVGARDTAQPSTETGVITQEPGALTAEVNQATLKASEIPLPQMEIIGESQQEWAPLRRRYNLFLHRPENEADPDRPLLTSGDLPLSNSTALQPSSTETPQSAGQVGQFAKVDEGFLAWDFSLKSADGKLLGSVNKNFTGLGREIFTDTSMYALRMDAAALAENQATLNSEKDDMLASGGVGMTLDQRAVMLATAVSIDFDYFSRKSGHGGGIGGMWPLWLPGGGGGAAAEGAGAEGAAEAGAVEGAEGVDGAGEAASQSGYELDPNAPQPEYGEQWSPQQGGQQGEDVWGQGDDPWGQNQGGGGGGWLDGLLDD